MALDFFAGCLGGCAAVFVGHPLDTVKVNLQTQDQKNPKYRGSLHCIKTLIAKDGLRGLYRGVTSPLFGVAGINAIVFGIYGNTQKHLTNPDSLTSHFLAGGVAGFFQSFLCSPMELAKSRLQVSSREATSPLECLRKIYLNEGTKGVFRGLNITITREVPAFAIYFWTYEYFSRSENNREISTGQMLFAGGMAGVVSWVLVYPVDVIKSRLQIDGIGGKVKYKNSWDCVTKSVKSEGVSCLFRGLTPTIWRAVPVNAVTFAVVTWTIRLLSSGDGMVEKRIKETELVLEQCVASTLKDLAPA